MDTNPKVSVILPVKNSALFLGGVISDLLNQSLKEIEILAIYDDSADETLDILRNVKNSDKRLKIVHGNSHGPGGARNMGMQLARGTYLSFIDSDDRLHHHMLEVMYREAERMAADICVCCSVEFKGDKKYRMIWDAIDLELLPAGVRSCQDCPDQFFQSFTGWAWDKLFRKSFCDEYGMRFGDNYVLEDGKFVLPSMAYAHRISVIDQVLIFHRRWEGSLESNQKNINRNWKNVSDNILGIRQELKKRSELDVLEKSFQNWAINYLLWVFRRTTKENRRELCKVLNGDLSRELGFHMLCEMDFYDPGDYSLYRHLIEHRMKFLHLALWRCRINQGIYKLRRYGVKRSARHLMWNDVNCAMQGHC